MRKGEIAARLFERVSGPGKKLLIEELRIGLCYAAVRLENGATGLAAVPLADVSASCSVFPPGGSIAGRSADFLLRGLVGGNPLEKTLGMAAANAVIGPEPQDETDALELIGLGPEDRVAMVGLFSPLVERIRRTGARLDVIEKDPRKAAPLGRRKIMSVLGACTVALITATSLLNDTLEETLAGLARPRHVAVLGPSSPLDPEIFRDTPVSHIGGAIVADAPQIMRVVSEGGGTPAMRPWLKFVNILL